MSKGSTNKERRISPPEEVIGLLRNSLELAMRQNLTASRDVIKAAKIVASDFDLDRDDVFVILSESVVSKPYNVLPSVFEEAFIKINSFWRDRKSEDVK